MVSNAVGLLARIDQVLAQRIGLRKTGDLDVIGLAIEVIGMQGERTGLPVEAQGPRALFGRGITAQFDGAGDRFLGALHRHAVRYDIDEATRRAAAVKQGRGAFDDFDLLGDDGFDGDGVILAQARDVEGGETILQRLHPIAAEAADHGPAGARTEIGRAHAQLVGKRLPDAGRDLPAQVVACNDGGRLGDFERALA